MVEIFSCGYISFIAAKLTIHGYGCQADLFMAVVVYMWIICTKPVLSRIYDLDYDAPFERETHPPYSDAEIHSISIQTEFMNKQLLVCGELVCDKNASRVWFLDS